MDGDGREKCSTCRFFAKLEKWSFSGAGVTHEKLDGYLCSAMLPEAAIWMTGLDSGREFCEMWESNVKEKIQ